MTNMGGHVKREVEFTCDGWRDGHRALVRRYDGQLVGRLVLPVQHLHDLEDARHGVDLEQVGKARGQAVGHVAVHAIVRVDS